MHFPTATEVRQFFADIVKWAKEQWSALTRKVNEFAVDYFPKVETTTELETLSQYHFSKPEKPHKLTFLEEHFEQPVTTDSRFEYHPDVRNKVHDRALRKEEGKFDDPAVIRDCYLQKFQEGAPVISVENLSISETFPVEKSVN